MNRIIKRMLKTANEQSIYTVIINVNISEPSDAISTWGCLQGTGLVSVHDWGFSKFPYKCYGFAGETYSGYHSKTQGSYQLMIETDDDEVTILDNLYSYYDKNFKKTFRDGVVLDNIQLEKVK